MINAFAYGVRGTLNHHLLKKVLSEKYLKRDC